MGRLTSMGVEVIKLNRERSARKALSLGDGPLLPEEIKAAYREAVKKVHPDHGGDPDIAADLIATADRARKKLMLLTLAEDPPRASCLICGGTGYVRRRVQSFYTEERCSCNKEGEK